jgi:transposase
MKKIELERELNDSAKPVQILKPYGVGIDTHSKFIAVCIFKRDGEVINQVEQQFNTDWESLMRARSWIEETLSLQKGEPFWYCIESTGTYHFPVVLAFGGEPSVVNPLLAGPTRRKTDVLDARLLAHHSITGLWPKSFLPSGEAKILRVLWAERGEFKRMSTRATNRINNIVLRWGHTFAATTPVRSNAGKAIIEDLVNGRCPQVPGVCPAGLPVDVRPVISRLLAVHNTCEASAKAAEKASKEFVEAHLWPIQGDYKSGVEILNLLQTVPGIGLVTSLSWLTEICDPNRFQDAKQVAAFCGCDPSLKVSAGKVTEHVRRKGNARLHLSLRQAAQSVLSRPSTRLGNWGMSIAGRHKKGGYRKACGAVARRLACCLWYVHKLGKPFDESKYNYGTVPQVHRIPTSEMELGKASKILEEKGYHYSTDVVKAYFKGELGCVVGVGDQTLLHIRDWIRKEEKRRFWLCS